MSRYSTDIIDEYWSDNQTLLHWKIIEEQLLIAQFNCGVAGIEERSAALVGNARVRVSDWQKETAKCGHEYNAFLRCLSADGVKQVHVGVTTSDITDTALNMKIRNVTTEILETIDQMQRNLRDLGHDYGTIPHLGRTHGQAAVMTTYGHMFEVWEAALDRATKRLHRAEEENRVCMASGPVGTYMHTTRKVEALLATRLGMCTPGPTTQIVMRDRLADWVNALVLLMSVFESIALELRLLSHSSIGEVKIPGPSSSSMPHKTNPSEYERISGLARMVRSAYEPIVSGIAVWHERDISHSSVEKELLPQITGYVAYTARFLSVAFERIEFLPTAGPTGLGTASHTVMTEIQLCNPDMTHQQAQERTKIWLEEELTNEGVKK